MNHPYYEDPADFKSSNGKRNYQAGVGLAIAAPGKWVAVIDESADKQGAVAGSLWHLVRNLQSKYPFEFEKRTVTKNGRVKGYLRVAE